MVAPLRGRGKCQEIFLKLEKKSERRMTTKLEGGGVSALVVGTLK